jgi:hypothetical protein
MVRKRKTSIPPEKSAKVLFYSDRTCCVCREHGKPVQIHHIDENPNNHEFENLAALCFDCHDETQIRGGFSRKLDADQISLYRDDWYRLVSKNRSELELQIGMSDKKGQNIELLTSLAEIYRENNQFELLAMLYDSINNCELRDKYIEIVLKNKPNDQTICHLRSLQGRPDLIPKTVIERELKRYTNNKDFLQRARFHFKLKNYKQAAIDYIDGIQESIHDKNQIFSAAFYLKEFYNHKLVEELFIFALEEARKDDDLWWQVRALEELGWQRELNNFVLENSEKIEQLGNTRLQILLAEAKNEKEQAFELRKQIAKSASIRIYGQKPKSKKKRNT